MSEIIMYKNTDNNKKENFKYDIKEFTRWRDVIASRLYQEGVIFFGVNINLPYYWDEEKDPELCINNDTGKKYTPKEAWEHVKANEHRVIKRVLKDIDLPDMMYIVLEAHENTKNKKMLGYPHIHMLLGVRSLIGRNESLRGEILSCFLKHTYTDVDINELKTERDITTYWNYIVKKANYKKGGLGREAFKNHYIYIYRYNDRTYAAFMDSALMRRERLPYAHMTNLAEEHRHNNITGLIKANSDDKYILINLWRVFMQRLEIFNWRGKLYQRNFKSRYSYDLLGDLSILKEKTGEILSLLQELFTIQLKYVDMIHLMSNYFEKALETVYNNPNLLPTRKIMFNLIEFSDGIYNISVDMFLKFNDEKHQIILEELDGKLTCVKYYGITYHHLDKPEYWLSKLEEQLGSPELLREFCTNFARLFHVTPPPFDIPKRNAVMVEGPSNTGKTVLLGDPVSSMYGLENIGLIGKGDFAFEHLINKVALVWEEFEYDKRTRSSLLRVLEGKPFLLNSKNKRHVEVVLDKPALLLSNKAINDAFIQDDAFMNRVAMYSFIKPLTTDNIDNQMSKKILAELPKIIVYCNRLFVKKHYVARKLRIANNSKKMVEKIKGFFLPKE